MKHLSKIPGGAILVTAGTVGLYPNISHDLGLQSLRKRLNETGICKVPTDEIISGEGLFSKTTTLNLMKNFASKYQEQLLELNLHHLMLVFSWMKWKPIFLENKNCSHSFGLDILMTYFLYEHMVKNNLIYFSKILANFIQT